MFYFYITGHGVSLGTIPNDLEFLILDTIGYKTIFCCNRSLTNKELSYYDIKKYCPNCHNSFDGYAAISREDNQTNICPSCGTLEALTNYLEPNC